MADDILGHDHLDHGKHLHKPGFHPKPQYWMGIWVKHPREAHHDDHGNHGHDSHGSQATHHAPAKAHSHVAHSSHKHHEASKTSRLHEIMDKLSWTQLLIALAIVIPIGLFVYQSWLGLVIAAIIIAVNIVVELHKMFTEGMPLDFEILTFGAAYLASTGYLFWALAVAVLGPLAADLSRGPTDEEVLFRILGVAVAAFAGAALGPTTVSVFIAAVFGIAVQFLIASMMAENGPTYNLIESGSTVAIAAYFAFFIVPLLPLAV